MKAMTVRLPDDLAAKIEKQAAENNRSLNGEIVTVLQSFFKKKKKGTDRKGREQT